MFTQRITPNPNISCKPGWCLEYVRRTFGLPAVPGYGTATAGWENSKTQHRFRDFPAGVAVPVWYALDNEPAGHVVLRMPDGSIYSTSDLGTVPHHHPNIADLEWYYAHYGMPLTYRGWTEDIQGTAVITAVTEKDGFEMAEVNEVVDALFNKKFKKGDGSGEVTLGQIVAWYDANRANDLEGIFNKKVNRAGGQAGQTSLLSTVAWLDSNIAALHARITSQEATIKALAGAVAATSKGEPFDQAKLLASIASTIKEALPTTVSFK